MTYLELEACIWSAPSNEVEDFSSCEEWTTKAQGYLPKGKHSRAHSGLVNA